MSTSLHWVLGLIEAEPQRTKKEEILARHKESGLLLTYLWWALNPFKVFHIANLPYPEGTLHGVGAEWIQEEDAAFGNLFALLSALDTREITGNEARVIATQTLLEMPEFYRKWAYRCLVKDIKIGMGVKSINKIIPGLIPEFKVALAETVELRDNQLTPNMRFPVWVDPKLDGIRCICVKKGGDVRLYTRAGHLIETVPSIVEAIKGAHELDFMLDGELMARNWNESQSTVFASVNKVDDTNMVYNVFDAMTWVEWDTQQCQTPYCARMALASAIVIMLGTVSQRVRLVGGKLAYSTDDVLQEYQANIALGYEGIMLKDPQAPYQFKRSRAIMKLKPKHTWEGTITGWQKGALNSKFADHFGAFVVNINGVETQVGGGYTDAQRNEIYEALCRNPNAFIGRIAEVEGQELTPDGKVRFPVFKRFRDSRDM